MASKPGSKYFPLYRFLQKQSQEEAALSFGRIESIIDEDLPPSARRSEAFWSNRKRGGYQAAAWLDAGFHVEEVDLEGETVRFRRAKVAYQVKRQGGTIRWNADMVRALRVHLGVNQDELAEILGVRQQTVSEWENEVYRPSRSRSKHLTLVAERADFPFEAGSDNQT